MVSYYSYLIITLYCIFLSHGGLIFVTLFQNPEDRLGQRHDGINTTVHIQWAA